MNLYILVEGDKTETKIYPAWLQHLAPQLSKIEDAYKVATNNYYLFSGGGIPSIFNHLVNAVRDINDINGKGAQRYDVLMVCLDTEEESREYIEKCIEDKLKAENVSLQDCELKVFEHKVCMESWFLGNDHIFKANPQDPDFASMVKRYDVSRLDPEEMDSPDDEQTKAQYHYGYLRKMFAERHMRYSKNRTKEVETPTYLHRLIQRYQNSGHISSFGRWYEYVVKKFTYP